VRQLLLRWDAPALALSLAALEALMLMLSITTAGGAPACAGSRHSKPHLGPRRALRMPLPLQAARNRPLQTFYGQDANHGCAQASNATCVL